MADFAFNIAKGRPIQLAINVDTNDPTNSAFLLVLYEAMEAQATLQDRDDKAAIDAVGGNTVATFTGYALKTLVDTDVSTSLDDTNNWYNADFADQQWTATSGNATVSAILYYDADTGAGTDANVVPLFHWDFAHTPNGGTVTAQPAAEGFVRST